MFMSLIGKFLNKLFVSAKIFGDEHLRISTEVIYVLETSRSEHRALLSLSLAEQGFVSNHRCVLFADPKFSNELIYRLESLLEKLEFTDSDVKIVPVSIFHGHFPNRELSWWRILFSERWGPRGWWSRFIILLVSGRQTILQLDQPFSLRQLMADEGAQPANGECG